jgi:mxaA protein
MKRGRPSMLLVALALINCLSLVQAADRPFGYVIGDIVEQRVHLSIAGRRLVPVELPPIERVGISLWRREVRQEQSADGESWLVLRYQIINAPQSLTVWQLPALHLASADPAVVLVTPESPFSVGPITPPRAFSETNLSSLRPDHQPDEIVLAPLERRLAAAAAVLVLSLLAWAAYFFWAHRSNERSRPFARAVRDLRSLPDDSPESWRRLQHALNDCAGQVVRADSLDVLFRRAPYLASERPALEQFCRDVSALFFGGGLPADAGSVHELASRLRRIERRAS